MPTKKAKVEPKAAHTPGPWEVCGEDFTANVRSPKNYIIAETEHVHGPGKTLEEYEKTHLANMRLISAAPELLAAAKRAVAKYQDSTCIVPACDCEVCQLAAAIAKATGTK